ncbi:MAG: tRNA preQ1(34) S-adenosylmethionine ribosyltransferase-isomerase QueA, partial [Coriobacteriales bacterium]|nr:tRNA preQ1(34) S-adenosylmethionine ribosyltransferase-isomerase QueA [Coriobacteriales bacterium]
MTGVELFDYELPAELVAHYPTERRDASRLLVVDRAGGGLADCRFDELPSLLRVGDLLVLNDSRVLPARLYGTKRATGARVEMLLLRPLSKGGPDASKEQEPVMDGSEPWEVLARPARRLRAGDVLDFEAGLAAHLIEKADEGRCVVRFVCEGNFLDVLACVGTVPLPPYISRPVEPDDAERYQTVYARVPGSVAAPTAGLHFTDELLDELRASGVRTTFVTLSVGMGTFRPVSCEQIEQHRMHEEAYHVSEAAAAEVNAARAEGRRVICVGTTSVRAIESAARQEGAGPAVLAAGRGSTDIFLYPGGRPFALTDGILTNFHLPRSTLLMLVAAFAGTQKMLAAYHYAIE